MKQKLIMALPLAAAFTLAGTMTLNSCEYNSEEINALKERINTLESMTGSTEPINFNYNTTDYNDEPVVKTTSYRFKGSDYETSRIVDFGDGNYGISVARYLDVNAGEEAEIYLTYNSETGEVTDAKVSINFYHFAGQNFYTTFYQVDTEAEFTTTVNSFSAAKGLIDISIHAETTENSSNNSYEGIPQTIDMSFKGKLSYYSF